MKKFIVPLLMAVLGSSAWAVKFAWPNYVDNSACLTQLTASYPECGTSSMPQIPQWTEAGSYEGFDRVIAKKSFFVCDDRGNLIKRKYKVKFWAELTGPAPGVNEYTIPLRDRTGKSVYRLKGLNGSSFDIYYKGCYVNPVKYGSMVPPCKEGDPNQRVWVDSLSLNELLGGRSKEVTVEFPAKGNMPFKLTAVEVTFARKMNNNALPNLALKMYTKNAEEANVRQITFPGFQMKYMVLEDWESSTGETFHFPLIGEKTARLNDRKCTLLAPSEVNFQTVKLTSQTVKVGSEIPFNLGLQCNGYFDGQDPNNLGHNLYSTGAHVTHTVTHIRLKTDNKVTGLDGKEKIALKHKTEQVFAENLYVEGSFSKDKECGVDPISIGESQINPKDNTISSSDTSVTKSPFTTIYWKLCKKNGNVSSGEYTGNATVQLRYK